jgi:hypothetical protein
LLHHACLSLISRGLRDTDRDALFINDQLGLGPFTMAGQSDTFATTTGPHKGRVYMAFIQLKATALGQLTHDMSKNLAERVALTPNLQVIMHSRLRRECSG